MKLLQSVIFWVLFTPLFLSWLGRGFIHINIRPIANSIVNNIPNLTGQNDDDIYCAGGNNNDCLKESKVITVEGE